MSDIRNPKLLYVKAVLFLILGATASTILLIEHPSIRVALLLGLAVWAFARAYYFAFYVVEHYIDPGFRYAGLLSFASHVLRRKRTS
jgi:hypothetical protein